MLTRSFTKTRKAPEVEVGSILIAKPFWEDNIYKRSVIFIVEHNHERTIGLIVNKLSNLNVHSALHELKLPIPLLYGGPMSKNLIVFLHNQPQIPESIFLGNNLYLGGDYETLREMIYTNKIDLRKIRFCAGSVEWGAGQLDSELQDDRWWLSEMNADEYFSTSSDSLWSYKLITDGHLYGLFEDYPDPSLN